MSLTQTDQARDNLATFLRATPVIQAPLRAWAPPVNTIEQRLAIEALKAAPRKFAADPVRITAMGDL